MLTKHHGFLHEWHQGTSLVTKQHSAKFQLVDLMQHLLMGYNEYNVYEVFVMYEMNYQDRGKSYQSSRWRYL